MKYCSFLPLWVFSTLFKKFFNIPFLWNLYTLVKSFLQELTVTNGVVSSYSSAASSDLFRNVEYFWMYPMTTNQNQYKVGVVLRFKMGNRSFTRVGADKDAPVTFKGSSSTPSKDAPIVTKGGSTTPSKEAPRPTKGGSVAPK